MATTLGNANAVLKDLTRIVEDELAVTQPQLYPLICSVKPEEGAYTRIPIPANMPFPKKFEAERSIQGKNVPIVQSYVQDTYELTISLDSDLVRNAKAYDFSDLVREATVSAKIFPGYLASQAVIAGSTNLAYDAVAFYGTTHKYAKSGTNTINNTASATGITVTQLSTDLATGLEKIKTFKDNEGRLLNPTAMYGTNELLIHCPVHLEQPFRQLLNSNWIPVAAPITSSGTQAVGVAGNQLQGIAGLFADGYLDANSTSAWYLHYVGKPQRPFVYLENYGLQVSVLGFGTEHEVKTNQIMIALKQRFVIGYYRFDRSVKIS